MTRPMYETRSDRENQTVVAQMFVDRYFPAITGYHLTPPRYPVDVAFTNGDDIKVFAEIKNRNVSMHTYPTYMISIAKIVSMKSLSSSCGVPCLLLVKWKDFGGYLDVSKVLPLKLSIGGRVDRNDDQDVEPVAHYEISLFKIFNDKAIEQ